MQEKAVAKIDEIVTRLRGYFDERDEVAMAFLFGSWAKGRQRSDSDVDIAVYFRPVGGVMEWENPDAHYESEGEIWSDLERMLGKNVELLVLNRAVPTVAESALRGIPLIVRDRGLYLDFMVRITHEAMDFREWVEGYWRLKERLRYGTRG